MVQSKKILVIEDNADIMFVISMILKDDGFEVVESSSLEVISELDTIKPDLILMDNLLKDGSGSEMCKKLKSTPSSSHIPIILISAVSNLPIVAEECLADGFIEKPFDLSDFVNKLRGFKMIESD